MRASSVRHAGGMFTSSERYEIPCASTYRRGSRPAIRMVPSLGPTNAVALRELASVSFAQQNYDAARRFYARAVEADPSDKLATGFLGCSLIRLGRIDEGNRFLQRAGPGAWSGCAPPPGSVTQPGMRQGMQTVPPAGSLPPATGQPNP